MAFFTTLLAAISTVLISLLQLLPMLDKLLEWMRERPKTAAFLITIAFVSFAVYHSYPLQYRPHLHVMKIRTDVLQVQVHGYGLIAKGGYVQVASSVSGIVKCFFAVNGSNVIQGAKILAIDTSAISPKSKLYNNVSHKDRNESVVTNNSTLSKSIHVVRTPFAGRIKHIVSLNDYVDVNRAIFEILSSNAYVSIFIRSAYCHQLSIGQASILTMTNGYTTQGIIIKIDDITDTATNTCRVMISMNHNIVDNVMKADDVVKISIRMKPERLAIVMYAHLYRDRGKMYVKTIVNNKIARKDVEIVDEQKEIRWLFVD